MATITGRVQVLGGDPARHAKRIGYVPQAATVSLAFPITVADLVALGLVGDPEILVLDEPTASIDPAGKSCIIELLERIATRRTVLLVSHDLAAAVPQATGVICVNRQVIHNPEPVLTRPMLNLIYGAHGPDCPMGMFIQDIASALPARDVSVRDPEIPHA